jgi:hypothetical protein
MLVMPGPTNAGQRETGAPSPTCRLGAPLRFLIPATVVCRI